MAASEHTHAHRSISGLLAKLANKMWFKWLNNPRNEGTGLMRSPLLEIKVEGVLRRTGFNNKILNDKHRLLKIRRAVLRKAF